MALTALLLGPAGAGGSRPPLSLDGSTWVFSSVRAKMKASAKGVGRLAEPGRHGLELRLLPGNAWEVDLDGAAFGQGTYMRGGRSGKRLVLTLDDASLDTLATRYGRQLAEAAAREGVDLTATLRVVRATARIGIQRKRDTLRAKLNANFALAGTASAASRSIDGAPARAIGKLEGVSAPVPLTDGEGQSRLQLSFRTGPTPASGSATLRPRAGARSRPGVTPEIWLVSPDRVRVVVTRVDLIGAETYGQVTIDLPDVAVTYDRMAPSLTALGGVEVSVPDGTYVSMIMYMSPTFEVLVDDVTNGLYSDPASPTGFASVRPADGPDFVPITVEWTGGLEPTAQAVFATPLTVTPSAPPVVDVLVHGIHTMKVEVAGATVGYVQELRNPVEVFPTARGVGKVAYYTDANTALNVPNSPLGSYASLFVFYEDAATPAYLFLASGNIGGPCPSGTGVSGAWNTAPEASPPWDEEGNRAGGYLGRDPSGVIAWALPTDTTYAVYDALMRMAEADEVGDTTLVACQSMTAVPPPLDGLTYASGAPPITPDFQQTLMLVAD